MRGLKGATSNKEKVYNAWRNDSSISIYTLSSLVNDEVKTSTIRNWISQWGRGKNLPSKAARDRVAELQAEVERLKSSESGGVKYVMTPSDDGEAQKLRTKIAAFQAKVFDNEETIKTLREDLKAAKKGGPRIIKLMRHDGKTKTIKDHTHPAFEEVIQLASMRMNIFLPGPAGCGKSHLAFQIAKSLGLKFYSISCTSGMSEGQLTGRLLPIGKNGQFEYVLAEYVKAYEQGGVFLCDEIDAADPNVMLVLNTSLANGHLPLPNRPENPVATKHKDFVFIAAANTFGRGADRLYVGRNQLDEATIDRFRIGTVEMDYDDGAEAEDTNWTPVSPPYHFVEKMKAADGLETQLCPNEDLRILLQWYRHKVRENRLERIISTRFMEQAYKMVEKAKWTIEKIEEKLFSGWSEDEIRKVRMEY